VVLPDYQGIGIGTKFQDLIVQKYKSKDLNVNCTTTTPALVNSMRRNKKWKLVRFGRMGNSVKGWAKYGTGDKEKNKKLTKSMSKSAAINRVTYSFVFA